MGSKLMLLYVTDLEVKTKMLRNIFTFYLTTRVYKVNIE